MKELPYLGKRKLIKLGDALAITIPKECVETSGLKKGQEVFVLANRDILISLDNNEKRILDAHKKIEELIQGD